MAPWLKVCVAFLEALRLVSSIHIGDSQPPVTPNPRDLLPLLASVGNCTHVHTSITHRRIIKNNSNNARNKILEYVPLCSKHSRGSCPTQRKDRLSVVVTKAPHYVTLVLILHGSNLGLGINNPFMLL